LRPGFYDNLGFRGRVDVTVPGTGMIWSVNYAHTDEIAGGGMKNGANDSWVRHVYGGVELRYDDVGVSGHVQGGWRRDRENAESIHDWSMWHVDGALGGPLWSIISLEGTGRFESYRQVPGSFEPDFMIAQAALTLNVAPWVSVAGMYEYSDQPPVVAPNHKHHLAAQVTYRFLPGSWLKVFFGSTRGGLKCSGGVCRVFPPFDGMRTELTVRF
ncbi:MAG: hypothetical protein FJ098_12505, partial [Deltaproteobacteria bacterium]|nr:hypothetical protein [Deltaproteobacteria bacterium]